ncbi:hypothetical protein H0H92_010333 [Tricholoma furcatifolium]|nr:hypothetical protein H0H92_010333 [Tricholoma furcatifolium]
MTHSITKVSISPIPRSIPLLPQRDTVYSDGSVHVESSPEFPGAYNPVSNNEEEEDTKEDKTVKKFDEFTHMHYSAATCDPNDRKSSHYGKSTTTPRVPRNDSVQRRRRTDLSSHQKRRTSKAWGKDGWKNVVVSMVSHPEHHRGDGVVPGRRGLPVTAHIYEYTTQASIFSSFLKISGPENPSTAVPIQRSAASKEKNQCL